ncbi:MAG: hypothetical protein MUF25_20910 [Pirellulaceae bacterium]|nr:hypothetical protein [Pirellulaceae bacterium]
MRCIVTAGPSWEPLDQVRRLTNHSTGRLGVELAAHLTTAGHRVTLLLAEQATWAGPRQAAEIVPFSSSSNLNARLQALASSGADAVLHAAAIGDFRFGKVWLRCADGSLVEQKKGKFSSRAGMLLAELLPTPKIIICLRDWFPKARLVGWKFEVEGDRDSALTAAAAQLNESRTDACIANGPAYGDGFGFVTAGAVVKHVAARKSLYDLLEEWLRR